MAIAYRILRDVDRAEDAVRQTLVTAWRELPTLRDDDWFDAIGRPAQVALTPSPSPSTLSTPVPSQVAPSSDLVRSRQPSIRPRSATPRTGRPDAPSSRSRPSGGHGRLLTWQRCPSFLLWATTVEGDRRYDVMWLDEHAEGNAAAQAVDKTLFDRILASIAITAVPATSSAPTDPRRRPSPRPSPHDGWDRRPLPRSLFRPSGYRIVGDWGDDQLEPRLERRPARCGRSVVGRLPAARTRRHTHQASRRDDRSIAQVTQRPRTVSIRRSGSDAIAFAVSAVAMLTSNPPAAADQDGSIRSRVNP